MRLRYRRRSTPRLHRRWHRGGPPPHRGVQPPQTKALTLALTPTVPAVFHGWIRNRRPPDRARERARLTTGPPRFTSRTLPVRTSARRHRVRTPFPWYPTPLGRSL